MKLKDLTFKCEHLICEKCGRYYYSRGKENFFTYYYGSFDSLKILRQSEIPAYISKAFFEICVEVRNEMRNESKTAEIRRLGMGLLEETEISNFIDLRFKVLKLIEHGAAWLYFEKKNQACSKNREISKTLKKVGSLLHLIVNQIMNKNSSKLQENLTSLQDSYSKVLTMF